jgi:D-alanine-D-alanine ligase
VTRKLRVLTLMNEDLVPPDDARGLSVAEMAPWKMEHDVVRALAGLEHEVLKLGVGSDLGVIRRAIEEFRPDISFNLIEEFHGVGSYDHAVVGYLELLRQAYTGCNSRGLMLARDKGLAKQILSYHRIRVPDFAVFPIGRKVRRPGRLQFPLMVKSTTEEGSVGISQASIVRDDGKLGERVGFIHEQVGTDAIAEEYIEGRELYVGVLGNERLLTFPVWELHFEAWKDGAPRIATSKVKWDLRYQKERGIVARAAKLPEEQAAGIAHLCRRVYRALFLSGYARIDLRLAEDGKAYVLEANPNPQLADGEDFADSAEEAGIAYPDLLQRILNLGLSYRAAWKG